MTSSDRRARSQSGITIIELLMVIVVGSIVLIPILGLLNQTLLRTDPTNKSAEASKQLRLFRSTIAADWSEAKVIKVGVGAADTECNQGNMSAFLGGNTGPRIAMHISGANPGRRVIYNTRLTPSTTDDPATIEILRRECTHRPGNDILPLLAPDGVDDDGVDQWQLGGSVNDPGGSQKVVVSGVKELRLPGTCNLQANWPKALPLPPYEMCDMNVTVVGMDNQVATIRLYQHVGRDS